MGKDIGFFEDPSVVLKLVPVGFLQGILAFCIDVEMNLFLLVDFILLLFSVVHAQGC